MLIHGVYQVHHYYCVKKSHTLVYKVLFFSGSHKSFDTSRCLCRRRSYTEQRLFYCSSGEDCTHQFCNIGNKESIFLQGESCQSYAALNLSSLVTFAFELLDCSYFQMGWENRNELQNCGFMPLVKMTVMGCILFLVCYYTKSYIISWSRKLTITLKVPCKVWYFDSSKFRFSCIGCRKFVNGVKKDK